MKTITSERGSAVLSDCGKYRYLLTRQLTIQAEPRRTILFVMLNPSTADAMQDDPTIRRCISFASQYGYTELRVVNLYAYRATDPADLKRAGYPVGDLNLAQLLLEAGAADTICCAWGKLPRECEKWANAVKQMLRGATRSPLMCLGKTKDGVHPRHPLYLAGNTPLQVL